MRIIILRLGYKWSHIFGLYRKKKKKIKRYYVHKIIIYTWKSRRSQGKRFECQRENLNFCYARTPITIHNIHHKGYALSDS